MRWTATAARPARTGGSWRRPAERWARTGSTIEANAAALGIDAGRVRTDALADPGRGADVVASAAGSSARRGSSRGTTATSSEARSGGSASRSRSTGCAPINDAHLRSLGADPADLGSATTSCRGRAGPSIPVAFTTSAVGPGPWVFATYREGGLGNLAELLHESGHALHMAAIRTRPAFAEPPDDCAAFFEAVADVVGWDVDEPAFQAHHLGGSRRAGEATCSTATAACSSTCAGRCSRSSCIGHPERRPNDVWAEIVADGLGHRARTRSGRGGRSAASSIDGPGYLANYAPVGDRRRRRVRAGSARSAATGRPATGLVRGSSPSGCFGSARSGHRPTLIAELLGGPLTEAPLLADCGDRGDAGSPAARVSRRPVLASDRDEHQRVDRDGEEQQGQVADRVLVEPDRAGRRGLLGRALPPQPIRLPQEDRAKRRPPRRGRSAPSAPTAHSTSEIATIRIV